MNEKIIEKRYERITRNGIKEKQRNTRPASTQSTDTRAQISKPANI